MEKIEAFKDWAATSTVAAEIAARKERPMTEPKRIWARPDDESPDPWSGPHWLAEGDNLLDDIFRSESAPYISASYLLSEEPDSLSDRMARFMCRWADAPTGGPSFDYAKEQFRAALEAALKEG